MSKTLAEVLRKESVATAFLALASELEKEDCSLESVQVKSYRDSYVTKAGELFGIEVKERKVDRVTYEPC